MASCNDGTIQPVGLLAPVLHEFAATNLGGLISVRDLSWPHAESEVKAVSSATAQAVLKVHRQGRKFANERRAYTEWLPRLRPLLEHGTAVPELLAVRSEHPRALLLGLAAGELLDGLRTAPDVEAAFHERAGRFLASLHGLSHDRADPVPLGEAYAMRLEAWLPRAAGIVPPGVTRAVGRALSGALPFIEAHPRVLCHRDFTPRNWLVNVHDGALTVIDFEHAQPDLFLADMQRLWVGVWRRRPDLRDSFLAGYGRRFTSHDEAAMRGLAGFWAFSTVVWAREHGDVEFERSGWETLDWLGLR